MEIKLFAKNFPLLLLTIILFLLLPLFVLLALENQELRKKAASNQEFPQVDLNNDGVINTIDLKLYQELIKKTPFPLLK